MLLLNLLERKKGERKQANCNAVVQNGRECTCHFTAVDSTVDDDELMLNVLRCHLTY